MYYDSVTTQFRDTHPEMGDADIVEEPVIVMDTLHSCFSHAIIDSCFPIYWVVDDLVSKNIIPDKNIRIFIRKNLVLAYPTQNLPLINAKGDHYNGAWKDI